MEDNNTQQRESIKLMKMSKGYQWEIKVLSSSIISQGHTISLTLGDKELTRLEEIDSELRKRFDKINCVQTIKPIIINPDNFKQKEGAKKK